MLPATLFTLLSLGASALAAPIERWNNASLEHGNTNFPFPVAYYDQAAGLVQQTYCPQAEDVPGRKVGDAVLLNTTGNGDMTQRVNLYHSNSLGLSLTYMGTNISSLYSIWKDVDFIWTPPDTALSLPFGAVVDQGFQNAWKETWGTVQGMVSAARASYPSSDLTLIGHSLGAAAATFALLAYGDAATRMITFGQPRMGNKVVADAVDARFSGRVSRMTNANDWVPHVVPRLVGAQHFSGEVWQSVANDSSSALFYPGQENIHGGDSVLLPPLNFDNHQGVYFHTQIGAFQGNCPATVGQN